MTQMNNREQKGIEIANLNLIKKIDDHSYKVKSQTSNQEHDVISLESGWVCSCPDSMYRNVKCKHVYALEVSLSIKKQVQERKPVIIEPISTSNCIYCKSDRIVKDGLRHNKYGNIQKFNCKECKRYFTINIGFEKMKHDPKGITTSMQLYFSGESLRNTAKSLKLLGMDVSHKTVYNWIKKYTGIMQEYSEKLKPQVSDTWRADEMYLKIHEYISY